MGAVGVVGVIHLPIAIPTLITLARDGGFGYERGLKVVYGMFGTLNNQDYSGAV